jgi:nitroreductase
MTPEQCLALLRSRRVVRDFTDEPVEDDPLMMIMEAGRWASSASNNRIHRFLVVRDRGRLDLVRAMSPGMLARPPALIVICTDRAAAAARQVQLDRDTTTWIDVGTAAMNMMVQAHAMGLGTCPTTSFSRAGVATVLELPERAIPEFLLQVGHPARPLPRAAGARYPGHWVREHAFWERYGRGG